MGMLDRIKKKQNEGLKEFVINMETTAGTTRGQIFTVGVLEDPIFMSYVMNNIRTFDDFMNLDSDDIDTVITSQEQIMTLFAKCLFGMEESKIMALESTIPHLMSKLKDELSYLKEVTPQEKEGARYYILKLTRKLQMDEKINGFSWKLPPQDVYYPKNHKDGKTKIHFESGVVAAEGGYLKGKRSGPWRHNYDQGQVLAEGDYFDGLKSGVWVFYYSNGNIKAQGKYKADLKQGTWKEWDRSGVMTETEYHEGVKK
jgi:antitoxin component YwqK of YwqJK toxin-antitoxin module